MASTRGTMDYETYMRLYRDAEFDDLNDDCMVSIFHYIPLGELLPLELVCHRWKYCQELIFARRKTQLVLTDTNRDTTNNSLMQIKRCFFNKGMLISKAYHHLSVDLSNANNAQLLLKKFPKITKLEVVYDKLDEIAAQLLLLLDAWKENLTHLKIIIYNSGRSAASWRRLFDLQINNLPTLKQLYVYQNNSRDFGIRDDANAGQNLAYATLSPALVSRLEEFYIGLNENANFSFDKFKLFKADSKLKSFTLDLAYYNARWAQNPHVPVFTEEVDEDFAKNLTHLAILWNGDISFFSVFNEKFTSLVYLHLTAIIPFVELVPKISKLRKLTDLRLIFSETMFPNAAIPSTTRVHALSSIQTLHLDCSNWTQHHWNHQQANIPHDHLKHVSHLLPNLNSFKLHIGYSGDYRCRSDASHTKEKCREVFLSSLSDYTKLRRVYLLNNNGYTGWDEAHSDVILAKYDVVYMLSGKQVLTINQTMYI